MKLNAVARIVLMLLLASMIPMAFDVGYTENELPVHNIETGQDYETIQDAMDAPETSDGHTIQVDAGVYSEHLIVYKSLKLVGEDRNTTIIDGDGIGTVVVITANNVQISGFTIRNSGSDFCSGICLTFSNNTMIEGNLIKNNEWGVWLEYAHGNLITENIVSNNNYGGIFLGNSTNNSISRNVIIGNTMYGTLLERSYINAITGNTMAENWVGLSLAIDSNNNTVSSNAIGNNDDGIHLFSSFNDIFENTIANNWYGIFSLHSGGNIIYHNNFVENTKQAFLNESYVDIWDNGREGNYWSEYNGTDADQDGIGETLYIVHGDSKDNYPLMGMFSDFTICWNEQDYSLTAICNSTISNFQFNTSLRIISFDVTGKLGIGFCRVTIPNILVQDLWRQNYSVLLNGEPWPFRNWTDSESTHLYFVYPHSEHKVVIVPEFPSALVLPLLVVVSFVIIALLTKKRRI